MHVTLHSRVFVVYPCDHMADGAVAPCHCSAWQSIIPQSPCPGKDQNSN